MSISPKKSGTKPTICRRDGATANCKGQRGGLVDPAKAITAQGGGASRDCRHLKRSVSATGRPPRKIQGQDSLPLSIQDIWFLQQIRKCCDLNDECSRFCETCVILLLM